MFTGLVQSLGSAELIGSDQLKVQCPDLLEGIEIGDSIAVDGLCLTVAEILEDGFIADLSPETVQRSTLQSWLGRSHQVNVERSLRVGDKIGGHFVSGHIDGIGELQDRQQTGAAWELSFTVPASIARYIVHKGSIAINGISLTVADLQAGGRWFQVAVIPHTYTTTNLMVLQPGDPVNIEADLLGKYVETFLQRGSMGVESRLGSGSWGSEGEASPDSISLEFLIEHGYG